MTMANVTGQLNPRHAVVSRLTGKMSMAVNDEHVTHGELIAAASSLIRQWAEEAIEIDRYPERFPELRSYFQDAVTAIDTRVVEDDDAS